MFDYLYYKLYQAALKSSLKDVRDITASAWFGALMAANILVINGFLSKISTFPFLFSNGKSGGVFAGLIIFFVFLYYRKDKRTAVLEKYSQENENQRIKGNVVVALYVALSFLLIYSVAFFRPVKL